MIGFLSKKGGKKQFNVHKDNDATPERLAIARAAGLQTELLEFVSTEGCLARRRQILDILTSLKNQGVLTDAQRHAGLVYLKMASDAQARTRVTMSYQGGVDNAHSRFDLLDFVELKTPSHNSTKAAKYSVPPSLRLVLSWLESTLEEDKHVSTLGNMYADGAHTSTDRGIFILKQALDWLAHHYRFKNVPATPQNERWLNFLNSRKTG